MILGYDEYSHKLSHTYYDIDPRFSEIIIPNTLNVKFSTIKEREGGTKILTPLVTFFYVIVDVGPSSLQIGFTLVRRRDLIAWIAVAR